MFQVFRKEFNSFFASPAAWLFMGAFLLVNLFIFFWAEAFFARNIADLKPLFRWMPILLIFLVAALTMRSWSEERRSGTLESLLTSPVSPLRLVLGKFFGSLALVALALLLTVPLPLTVSLIGPLDWGPVLGGYLASLFLAAAYIAIGLYMSARTDNPVVALILTVAVAGIFYLLGSGVLTGLFGHKVSGFMELLGTGSRFDSITRGVLDVRDLYYYLSIVGIFLALNLFSLERFRWAGNPIQSKHKQWMMVLGLAVLNFILANVWLNPIGSARVDLTEGKIYSLSDSTRQYLQQLQEPLLIRGYFSSKSHPLLEPLTPQIKDLLEEYQIVGGDRVRVEFVDPHTDQSIEEEAAEKYGIRPVPFRMASRYESGVVNSYFDLVVAYGDQYETLTFNDLIEVKGDGSAEPEVLLKNPEYAITRSVKKIANAYQAGGNIFSSLKKPVQFTAYVSAENKLPQSLAALRKQLTETVEILKKDSTGKFEVMFADPDADPALATQLQKDYGFGPQIANIFDPKPFWFYMLLQGEGELVQVPLPNQLDQSSLKQSIEAAVKRMAPGYLKTIALVTPPQQAPANPYMQRPPLGKTYSGLRQMVGENARIIDTDLKDGQVPTAADMLVLLGPDKLDDKQLFAVDQFLMQGGTVMLATSAFDVAVTNSLDAKNHTSGMEDWLKHHGLTVENTMVLDPQNASLPVPVRRQLGGLSLNEIKMMPYPHFPDLRGTSLSSDNPTTSALRQLTLNWASPIDLDKEKNKERNVAELLKSSNQSWVSEALNIMPNYRSFPRTGFKPVDERGSELLAVAVDGRFESWFKGKDSPLLETKDKPESPMALAEDLKNGTPPENETNEEEKKTVVSSVIERSSDSARIILLASNTFASDQVQSLASQAQGTYYTRPLEFIQNAIDWSLDDQSLLSIRGRAQFARTLQPMTQSTRFFWEYLNYGLAILGLMLVWGWRKLRNASKQKHYTRLLAEV